MTAVLWIALAHAHLRTIRDEPQIHTDNQARLDELRKQDEEMAARDPNLRFRRQHPHAPVRSPPGRSKPFQQLRSKAAPAVRSKPIRQLRAKADAAAKTVQLARASDATIQGTSAKASKTQTTVPQYAQGSRVQISGLKGRSALNGEMGTVQGNSTQGSREVKLDNGEVVHVKPENLEPSVTWFSGDHLDSGGDWCTRVHLDGADVCEPRFLVIGAQTAGTLSLAQIFSQHELFKSPKKKELSFLSSRSGQEHAHGCSTDRQHWKRYLREFPKITHSDKPGTFTGEFSSSSFECTCCADVVRANQPTVKLIVVLRDPFDRARSRFEEQQKFHFSPQFPVKKSWDQYSSDQLDHLEECFQDHETNPAGCAERDNVLGWSLYDLFLANWLDRFNSTQLKVVYVEDLKDAENTNRVMREIETFLHIPPKASAYVPTRENLWEKEGAHRSVWNSSHPVSAHVGHIRRDPDEPRRHSPLKEQALDAIAGERERFKSPEDRLRNFYAEHMKALKVLLEDNNLSDKTAPYLPINKWLERARK